MKKTISDAVSKMLEAKAVMAPMSGITDIPFRMMVRRFGCKFAFTEMIDVNSIYYKNKKAFRFLEKGKNEGPLGVQIVGQDIEKIIPVAKICEQQGFELLDFNAGCPARKVIKCGKGSALLREPGKLGAIIEELVRAVNIPVTVKIRSGWSADNINYLEIAKTVESAGAAAICIHPRTREQMYKGTPDMEAVGKIKKSVTIPVFASGNMFSLDNVETVLKQTACDGVFIARGALGRPWIFREIEEFFREGEKNEKYPDLEFIKKVMKEQFKLNVEYYGEYLGLRRMYKHMCWYLKKRKNLDSIMKQFRDVKTYDRAEDLIGRIALDENKHLCII